MAGLERSLAEIQTETSGLRTEQARLDRIHSTAPARSVLAQARQELAALGAAPALPGDASARRVAEVAALEQATRELERGERRRGELAAELAGLHVDAALLAEAEAITALAADRSRIVTMREDRQEQMTVMAQHSANLDRAGAQLGLDGGVRARVPDALARGAAERLLREHTALSGARAQAEAGMQEAGHARDAAERAVAGLAAPEPAEALREAAEAAKREGRIDEALAEAEAAYAAAAAMARERLAGLTLWQGTAEALAGVAVPLEAEALRLAGGLEAAQAAAEAAQNALAVHDRALCGTRAELEAMTAAGPLPTEQAVAAARRVRDTAWGVVRARFLAGGPAGPEDVVIAVEQAVREADALADTRLSAAQRLDRLDRLREVEARDVTLREALAGAVTDVEAMLQAAQHAWRAAWAPCGIVPLDPAPMREWVRNRETVLTAQREAAVATRKRETVQQRHARCWLDWRRCCRSGAAPVRCNL